MEFPPNRDNDPLLIYGLASDLKNGTPHYPTMSGICEIYKGNSTLRYNRANDRIYLPKNAEILEAFNLGLNGEEISSVTYKLPDYAPFEFAVSSRYTRGDRMLSQCEVKITPSDDEDKQYNINSVVNKPNKPTQPLLKTLKAWLFRE
jgi:hypothetical protein